MSCCHQFLKCITCGNAGCINEGAVPQQEQTSSTNQYHTEPVAHYKGDAVRVFPPKPQVYPPHGETNHGMSTSDEDSDFDEIPGKICSKDLKGVNPILDGLLRGITGWAGFCAIHPLPLSLFKNSK